MCKKTCNKGERNFIGIGSGRKGRPPKNPKKTCETTSPIIKTKKVILVKKRSEQPVDKKPVEEKIEIPKNMDSAKNICADWLKELNDKKEVEAKMVNIIFT